MKKILLLSPLLLALVAFSVAADTSIIDALNRYNEKNNPVITKPNVTLTQFSSCNEVSTVLTKFIKDNEEYFRNRNIGYPMPIVRGGLMEDEFSNVNALKSSDTSRASGIEIASSTRDFSTTNNQVAGVDEPDILKTNGTYYFYVNERTRAIDIIKSPLNISSSTIDLTQAKLVNELKLPQSFWGTQLFIQNNTLVIIGQRYRENTVNPRFLDTNTRTTVLVFDISDVMKPTFLTLKDLPGNYQDARLINDKLVLIQQLYSNRGWGYNYRQRGLTLDSSLVLPSSIDVSRSDQGMQINNKQLPVSLTTITPDCNSISYALPDSQTLKHYNLDPNFTIISQISISNPNEKVKTNITIGTTQTIHVSQNSIYLAQGLYTPTARTCPMNARCIMPNFSAGQQTLVHKFSLNPSPVYKASNIIQGSPLSQYSMSEDNNGNFLILTTQWNEQQSTHLFTFDSTLDPLGKLTNIQPGESFQSSRFIEDKLYLVTFEQIDPLFVIDLKNLQDPRIIGELKIPGYSTYLHPRGKAENGIQYLIGLGYDTATNPWGGGGTINSGIKIDLYKIDYTKKDSNGNIQIFQIASKTLGGMDSQTEATYNSRAFVWDDTRKNLILALSLTTSTQIQQCTANYNSFGAEIPGTKQCYPNILNNTIFAGTKLFHIKPETGITEKLSYDYSTLLKKDKNFVSDESINIQPRQFQSYMNRVGYAGDVIFTFNHLFGHVAHMTNGQEKFFELDYKTPIK